MLTMTQTSDGIVARLPEGSRPQETIAQDGMATIVSGARNHEITIERGTATAGTATLTARAPGSSAAEPVNDAFGAAITWNLAVAGAATRTIENRPLSHLYVTVTGSNGTTLATYNSW